MRPETSPWPHQRQCYCCSSASEFSLQRFSSFVLARRLVGEREKPGSTRMIFSSRWSQMKRAMVPCFRATMVSINTTRLRKSSLHEHQMWQILSSKEVTLKHETCRRQCSAYLCPSPMTFLAILDQPWTPVGISMTTFSTRTTSPRDWRNSRRTSPPPMR